MFGFEQVVELAQGCMQQYLLHSCPQGHVGVAPKSMVFEGVEFVLLSSFADGGVKEGRRGGRRRRSSSRGG